MSIIKAVIFDADGVVNDGKLMNAEQFGITFETMQPFFRGPFVECRMGKADLRDVLPAHLKEWRWKGTLDEFLDHWFISGNTVNPKVVDTIRMLRTAGIKTYLGTNQEKHRLEYMRKQMDYQNLFDGIFASAELKAEKPHREFFELVHKNLPYQKEEILFWDDSEKNVEAARHYGFHTEHFVTDEDFAEKMARYFPDITFS